MKLYLVGGFLGSGKTTAITTACQILLKQKIPVAVITNDQGSELVDTAFTDSLSIPNTAVKNGCFCCNYEQFFLAIQNLTSSVHPDIVFGEAVGSCADLVATVVRPLRRFEPAIEIQLSVFADGPVLLSSLQGRSSFISENIQYIYKKQLEEATILVVNKADLLSDDEVSTIQSMLKAQYADKLVLFQDSKKDKAVQRWLDFLQETHSVKNFGSLDIDYEKYGNGEAALAWLDASLMIHSKGRAIEKSLAFVNKMVDEISLQNLAIGHLKFFLQSGDWHQKISFTSDTDLAGTNGSNTVKKDHVALVVNARVEAEPDRMKQIFFRAIKKIESENCYVEVSTLDSFQPGYPMPTHRFAE